jgi:DNA-binding Lrp family transcriptional regulator
MAYTDLEALKERLKAGRNKPRPKRTYRKRVNLSPNKKVEIVTMLREACEFVDEAILERDAKMFQAYKMGLSGADIAEAMGINQSALAKRLARVKAKLNSN